MRKPRPRDVKYLAHDHTGNEEFSYKVGILTLDPGPVCSLMLPLPGLPSWCPSGH